MGLLPDVLAAPLARLESYGMMILIGVLLILPMIGAQLRRAYRDGDFGAGLKGPIG